MSWVEQKLKTELDDIPKNWDGFTREAKVQLLLDIIQNQISKVRNGVFDLSLADRVAALVLECQMELTDFYADVEANSRNAKHNVDFIENEAANEIAGEFEKKGGKLSEAAIKRKSLATTKVSEAKKNLVDYEREYKKWRYVYDLLKEAHIMFRNITKL